MEINRKGTVEEYKSGHYYLTRTLWEDGHCEIEIHKCIPELIWHSCDQTKFPDAQKVFSQLEKLIPTELKLDVLDEKTKQIIN